MKKLFKLLLTFCICTGLILSAFSTVNAAATTTSGSCGTNLSWTLSNNGTLTVSGTGEMRNFSSSTMPWFSSRSSITSVIIEEGVTSIGKYAFYNCTNLSRVTIPSTVTSIGDYAFMNCTAIKDIYYNGTEEQWSQITLASRVFSLANYSQYIYYTGGSCGTNLTWSVTNDTLTISGEGDMEDRNYAPWYAYADEITSIIIGDGVTSIGANAFLGFSIVNSITIPKGITKINTGAFRDCAGLTSINVDAENANYASLDGNLFNKDHTTLIQYTIGKAVESYAVPESVTNISDHAFEYCAALTDITIPKNVSVIGYRVFTNCSKLKNIYVDEDNPYFSSPDGNLFDKEQTRLIYYAIGKSDTSYTVPGSVATIDAYAFYNSNNLSTISLPDSLLSIGVLAFNACTNLSSITIPHNVTSIGEAAFQLCSNLSSVSILANITSIESFTFYNCSALNDITLPNSVTNIGEWAFYRCSSLSSIILPDKITSINNSTFMYSGLTNITIPDSVTRIADQAFLQCTALKDVTILNGVTSIATSAFSGCTSLSNITLPNSVTSIGTNAFSRCTSLSNITLPNSITNIADQAFLQCTNLKNITIPKSVISIGSGVFYGCSALKDVYYGGTEEQWNNISLGNSNTTLTNANIYYNCPYHSNMTTIFYDGTTTEFYITPDTEYSGNTIVCALYKNQILSDIRIFTYSGNALEYATTKPHDELKIMIWKSLSSITPICEPEVITSTKW